MPIYEFECEQCATRFVELVESGTEALACPSCGSRGRRLLSAVSPPGRLPRGARVRDSEARRRERGGVRSARLADARKSRKEG
jgi:putative FmdB family regulatory protein